MADRRVTPPPDATIVARCLFLAVPLLEALP